MPGKSVRPRTCQLGHLLIQRGLEHRFGQLFEQPVGPGQRQALFLGQSDQLDRSLLLS